MKSVKPGRGPSMMGGIMGIAAALFGIFWTVIAPGFLKAFGLVFVAIAVIQTIYHFKNATGQNRYSSFDIVEDGEEPEPLNQCYGSSNCMERNMVDTNFCPYCGAPAEDDHSFCRRCGKSLK